MDNTTSELLSYIRSLDIIDTHEHLPAWEAQRNGNDFFSEYLIHYLSCDLVSSGLPLGDLERVKNSELDVSEKWDIVERYWERCRQTGYAQSLEHAVRLVYNIDGINKNTVAVLQRSFSNAKENGHHYQHVLKDICHIKTSLLDENLDCDKRFFHSLYRIDKFVMPVNFNSIHNLGIEINKEIKSLSDWCMATEQIIDRAIQEGAAGFKCALAYNRALKFEKIPFEDAEKSFIRIVMEHDESCFKSESLPMQDYMMHYVLGILQDRGKTLQIHTGLQEGNGNYISNSNVELMNNLFFEYPNMKFDILHSSYPYHHVLGALSKNFPNVSINMAWTYIISPVLAAQTLNEYLDLVASNKILGFGGDYCFIDGVAGHWYIATQCIAEVLAERIRKRTLSMHQACHIAQQMLYSNPCVLYGLSMDA